MTPTKVLVVEGDSAIRRGLCDYLAGQAGVEVVASARTVRTAEPKLATYQPDIVVLDFTADATEALAMLERFRDRQRPLRVVAMASDRVDERMLTRAAGHGCTNIVRRQAGELSPAQLGELGKQVASALLTVGVCRPLSSPGDAAVAAVAAGQGSRTTTLVVPTAKPRKRLGLQTPQVLAIGVSTGGPAALARLLPGLPADFALPVVIVQHMPAGFTASLAQSLDRASALHVREAAEGDPIERGTVLIAPGGQHLRVRAEDGRQFAELTKDPPECSCRPSVDYLFRSLVPVYHGRVLGVVLTGMGEDGWIGSRELHRAGACLLAQDKESSTVFGMPRGPIEEGLAEAVPLDEMARAIVAAAGSLTCS